MFEPLKRLFGEVPEVSVEEALALRDKDPNVVFVDVRTPEEIAVSVIPNAITKETFEADRNAYRSKTIIPYCTVGSRSGKYTKKLVEDGFKAYNLRGAILAWVNASQPVVDDKGQPTKRVHVNGPKHNALPEGYEAVW
ncbi:MAG: rhodanese-like domain-containing protein [Candidatus Hydrogenedentes bacterium]|nr:rhodanese-like domain-containing protein [Candidatus Hydrogenedentota bacterium]